MNPILELNHMTKLYSNHRGIEDFTLSLRPGEVVGLLGPNGSGKTTAMRVITGLAAPDTGTVTLFGHDITEDYEAATQRLGALIELPALYSNLTALQNLRLAAAYYADVDEARIQEILSLVHLDRYQKDKAGRFSLGMKQRLGLALALLSKPELVVLDEPTNGLDIEGMVMIRDIIRQLAAEQNAAVLVSSHLAAQLEKTCDRIAVLHEGRLLALTSVEEALQSQPTLEDYFLEVVRNHRGGAVV